MEPPKFSVVVLMRNEAKTLPRLAASLHEHFARGGELVCLDTGSSDGSADVARSLGAKVTEVGDRFRSVIDAAFARQVNERFVVGDEAPVVQAGETLFDFSAARNYAATLASNDWVFAVDADEQLTVLNIDEINKVLENPKVSSAIYEFVFAHDPAGRPAVQFISSKLYRRTAESWSGCVHEVRHNIDPVCCEIPYIPPTVLKLDHYQNEAQHRGQYLKGLMIDCTLNKEKDRQSHYAGRELFWTGRPKSAIKELQRHIAMNCWPAERAQSMVFLGDAFGAIGQPEEQSVWYHRAFELDPTRREALLRLAGFYKGVNKPHATAAYAAGALQIPYHGFYANQMSDFTVTPHIFLYWAKGWMGDVMGAQHHILEVLRYEPFNAEANRDLRYYFEYDPSTAPEGWMVPEEMLWLHDAAKGKKRILEVGSWKGRSTHALATGAGKTGGTVWAVDHFSGSVGEDVQHAEAKADPDSVYRQFMENTKQFKNLIVHRADSLEAAKCYPDGWFDFLFIDGGHTEEECRADILAWAPKVSANGLLAGHDWGTWEGVTKAVRSVFGEPDGVHCSIWHVRRK